MSRTLVYEHKCRKCQTETEMYFGDEDMTPWIRFAEYMSDMVTTPRCEQCETCGRWTVHDVISYSGPFNT